MKFVPLISGQVVPELYHVGFKNQHLKIFMSSKTWNEHFAGNFRLVTPWVKEPSIGAQSVINWDEVEKTYDLFEGHLEDGMNIVVQVRVVPENDRPSKVDDFKQYTKTIHEFLEALFIFTADRNHLSLQCTHHPQLFVVTTCVNEGMRTGYELEVTISPQALAYVGKMNKEQFAFVERLMDECVVEGQGCSEVRAMPYGKSFVLKAGNASVGPGGEVNCLRGHNVDNPAQQLVLLVGLAVIWQMVREGVKVGSV